MSYIHELRVIFIVNTTHSQLPHEYNSNGIINITRYIYNDMNITRYIHSNTTRYIHEGLKVIASRDYSKMKFIPRRQ